MCQVEPWPACLTQPTLWGRGVCSQSFTQFLTYLPVLELAIIALIACSHEVFALKFSKAVFEVLTKSRSKAGWPHDVLLPSEVPAGPDPPRHHMGWHRGDYWGGKRYNLIGIDRQTDPLPLQNQKLTVWFFSPSASRKMMVTLLHKTYRCGEE